MLMYFSSALSTAERSYFIVEPNECFETPLYAIIKLKNVFVEFCLLGTAKTFRSNKLFWETNDKKLFPYDMNFLQTLQDLGQLNLENATKRICLVKNIHIFFIYLIYWEICLYCCSGTVQGQSKYWKDIFGCSKTTSLNNLRAFKNSVSDHKSLLQSDPKGRNEILNIFSVVAVATFRLEFRFMPEGINIFSVLHL